MSLPRGNPLPDPIETPQRAFEAEKTATVTTAPPEENTASETVEQHLPVEPEKKFDTLPVEAFAKERNSRRLRMNRRMNCRSAAM